MRNDNQKSGPPRSPSHQTGEAFGSVKRRQRGEDDFKGRSDAPRGSEAERRGASGPRS